MSRRIELVIRKAKPRRDLSF